MARDGDSRREVPFFRPSITEAEIAAVTACLRSGWLTTGPRVRRFEAEFAAAVGAPLAVAVNSGTAALHLAVEALGLKPGQAVLVPTMTFAATAEVVRYQGAAPLLVDCDPVAGLLDLDDAERKLADLRAGRTPLPPDLDVVGVIPVHVGGLMLDVAAVREFARRHKLWVIEDAAHSFPAAWRAGPSAPWRRCGEDTAAVTCFSFYANKTITTAEGGMAATSDPALADRMRQMSLHGLSHDAWKRFEGNSSWDYRIVAPGYKYNMTDVAAAIGGCQLARARNCGRSESRLPRPSSPRWPTWRRSSCRRSFPTASTPGTCFPSVCGWKGWTSIGTVSWRCCARAGSAARCIGGRCTCIPITKIRSAGVRSSFPSPAGCGSG